MASLTARDPLVMPGRPGLGAASPRPARLGAVRVAGRAALVSHRAASAARVLCRSCPQESPGDISRSVWPAIHSRRAEQLGHLVRASIMLVVMPHWRRTTTCWRRRAAGPDGQREAQRYTLSTPSGNCRQRHGWPGDGVAELLVEQARARLAAPARRRQPISSGMAAVRQLRRFCWPLAPIALPSTFPPRPTRRRGLVVRRSRSCRAQLAGPRRPDQPDRVRCPAARAALQRCGDACERTSSVPSPALPSCRRRCLCSR